MGRVRALVIDKTGTLTVGAPEETQILSSDGAQADDIFRLAASLDQASKHVTAEAIVAEAHRRGFTLATPSAVTKSPGEGVSGMVAGKQIVVGGRRYVSSKLGIPIPRREAIGPGTITVADRLAARDQEFQASTKVSFTIPADHEVSFSARPCR